MQLASSAKFQKPKDNAAPKPWESMEVVPIWTFFLEFEWQMGIFTFVLKNKHKSLSGNRGSAYHYGGQINPGDG